MRLFGLRAPRKGTKQQAVVMLTERLQQQSGTHETTILRHACQIQAFSTSAFQLFQDKLGFAWRDSRYCSPHPLSKQGAAV
jgi:hypothetical protein